MMAVSFGKLNNLTLAMAVTGHNKLNACNNLIKLY